MDVVDIEEQTEELSEVVVDTKVKEAKLGEKVSAVSDSKVKTDSDSKTDK